MRDALRAGLTAAGAALLVCACGQKGPLYLPDKGGKVVTSTPAATTAPPAGPATAAPAAAVPENAPPAGAAPDTAPPAPPPAAPKPAAADKDQDQPPKP